MQYFQIYYQNTPLIGTLFQPQNIIGTVFNTSLQTSLPYVKLVSSSYYENTYFFKYDVFEAVSNEGLLFSGYSYQSLFDHPKLFISTSGAYFDSTGIHMIVCIWFTDDGSPSSTSLKNALTSTGDVPYIGHLLTFLSAG